MSKMHVSQTFYSVQGEGVRTGKLAVWLRLFGCPLRCQGFSQMNPKDPTTYIKPMEFIDPKSITTLDDFPVVDVGCDTLYAISPKFKHLRRDMEVTEVYDEVVSYLPSGQWTHPVTHNEIDLAITGGEPLLQQDKIAELLWLVADRSSKHPVIQFETNLVKGLEKKLASALQWDMNNDVYFNVSPKLYAVSGENYEWSADNLLSLADIGSTVTLKVVVNERDNCWKELNERIEKLYKDCGNWLPPVYIMPVGSTREQQTNDRVLEEITRRAISEGYHVSGRLHCVLLGNDISA